MHLGRHNRTAQCRLGSVWLQRSLAGDDLEDKHASWEFLQQQWQIRSWAVSTGAFLAEIDTRASHCSQHLDRCARLWSPKFKKDTNWRGPKGGPWRWPKGWRICPMRQEWRNKRFFFTWRREIYKGTSFMVFHSLKGSCREDRGSLFTRSLVEKLRGIDANSTGRGFLMIQERNFFTAKPIIQWNTGMW